jgi:DNA-binding response OmpR family regulator
MKTILLIEDNYNILENLIEYLELEGFKIFSTNDGKRGIELARLIIPDLIICDTPKPGIDGYEVLRLLLDTADTYEIPFIFCSALSEANNRSEALELGADDFIVKPFELETMLQKVNVCIASGSKRLKYAV